MPLFPSQPLTPRFALKLALSLGVGGVSVYLATRGIDPPAVLEALRALPLRAVVIYLATLAVTHLFRAWRWEYLLRPLGVTVPLRRLLLISSAGFMAILALPVRLGEFVRPYFLTRERGVRMSAALGTVAVERVIDGLLISIVFFVSYLASAGDTFSRELRVGAWLSLVGFVSLTTFLLLARKWPERTIAFALRVSLLERFAPTRAHQVRDKLRALISGFDALADHRNFGIFLLQSVLYWGVNGLGMWILARQMDLPISLAAAYTTMAFTGVILTLPNSPGLVGQFHFAIKLGLLAYLPADVVNARGFAYALVLHGLQTVWYVGTGVLSLPALSTGRRRASLGEAVRESNRVAEDAAGGHLAMATGVVDLRSDTVTRPSPGMRAAMAAAEVGDDVLGDDPTVRRLQDRCAELLGTEGALFVPSGTMANQIALKVHCAPGDDVLACDGAHLMWYEAGAAGAIAGVQMRSIGRAGMFADDDVVAAFLPGGPMQPPTRLVCVENTHNRAGGVVWSREDLDEVVRATRGLGGRLHLDGARLYNAAVALSERPRDLAAGFDTVSLAFSKGLGAPVGSVIAGSRDSMARALRFRRMFGGAMRQAGVLAAAALYALDHNVERLAEDHANARLLAERLAAIPGLVVDSTPPSNIVMADLSRALPTARELCQRLEPQGVLCLPFGERRLRFVTHLDVDADGCARAADAVAAVLRS